MTLRYLSKQLNNGTAELCFARTLEFPEIYTHATFDTGLNFKSRIPELWEQIIEKLRRFYTYLQWRIIESVRGQIEVWCEMQYRVVIWIPFQLNSLGELEKVDTESPVEHV